MCEFVQAYFESISSSYTDSRIRASSFIKDQLSYHQFNFTSTELLKLCIEQIHTCDVENYRNLNKLSILMTLLTALLRVNTIKNQYAQNENSSTPTGNGKDSHIRLYLKLIKNVVQVK